MIKVLSVPQEKTSPLFAKAFAQGCGGKVWESAYTGGIWAGFGSPTNWDTFQQAVKNGCEYYYGDHAYFGRHRFYKITKNDLFHYGIGKSNGEKLRKFYTKAKPWVRGGKIIVCPQSDGFFQVRYKTTQAAWLKATIDELKKYTDRPIVIHGKRDPKPLVDCLHDAHCVVSHSSNSAVEALMNGVPAINTANSMARDMARSSLSDIENLMYPENRFEWAAVLADNQFSLAEMADGTAWRHLNETV